MLTDLPLKPSSVFACCRSPHINMSWWWNDSLNKTLQNSSNSQLLPVVVSCEGVWWLGDERREVPQLPGSPAASVRALCGLLRLGLSEEKRAFLSERGHGLLPHPQRRQQLHPDGQEARQPSPWVYTVTLVKWIHALRPFVQWWMGMCECVVMIQEAPWGALVILRTDRGQFVISVCVCVCGSAAHCEHVRKGQI